MGFCPYIHSLLLRTYSLMDPRFSLLGISLKNFIKLLEIKNCENKMDFLNSFSWMILLITFLQDIIKPPILPKLLSNNNNPIKSYKMEYGQNNPRFYNKNFSAFLSNIKTENTFLRDSLFDKKSLIQAYKEQIGNNEKNNLSCAEIFLYFLEFIIYYFKSDSIYINCSIENEGYESIYYILNNNNECCDDRFQEYFKKKYYKKTRDGVILIRDPLDPHYNPAQTLKGGNYDKFIDSLKMGYLNLLKKGDLNKVNVVEKDENKNEIEN